ncbi:MAG: hypothetical protein JSU00_13670 [Acidobacteria bacterium]|nr:hypothetical protein [Acidobacteriota bacterium]
MFLAAFLPFLAVGGVQSRLSFEPNYGQTGPETRYIARTATGLALVRDAGVTLIRKRPGGSTAAVRMELDGANRSASWRNGGAAPGSTSYLLGNNRERWIRDIPHYSGVTRGDVYSGVDWVLYGAGEKLEFDFAVRPGAHPGQIRMRFPDSTGLSVSDAGDLLVATPSGTLVQGRPRVYQTLADGARQAVPASYVIRGRDRVSFAIGRYDRTLPLIIDPVLQSATWLGGSGADRVILADSNAVVGTTTSADFPGVEVGRHSGSDIFVYLPQQQSTLIIGGTGDDVATCADARSGSYVAIGGYTNSRDFPLSTSYTGDPATPPYPTQPAYGGGDADGFLIYLYGSAIGFSTYIGGSGDDRVLGIQMGSYFPGPIAVVGSTTSPDFPTVSPWQATAGGGTDGFVTLINYYGVVLSSYLGGSGDDRATAVTASSDWTDIYIAGETRSDDWRPPGAFSGTRKGGIDAFLIHLTSATKWLSQAAAGQSVIFGGSGDDRVAGAVLQPNGLLAVAGSTSSADLFADSAPKTAYAGGETDIFAARYSPDLRTRVFGTFVGGAGADEAVALATDAFNELLVAGWTNSSDFPALGDSLSPCGQGSSDGAVVLLDSAGAPLYSSCYGGSGGDRITSFRSDGAQKLFAGGYSDSPGLPLRQPVQAAPAGPVNGFFATLALPIIHASDIVVGKDLSAPLTALLGDPSNYVGVVLTATSSDAARVLLARDPDDAGAETITVGNGSTAQPAERSFRIGCLTGDGAIPVTLTAPGYSTRTIQVRCVPPVISVSPTELLAQAGAQVIVAPAAADPDSRILAVQYPRAGAEPIRVDISNPSPDVLKLDRSSILIDSTAAYGAQPSFEVTSITGGPVTVTLTASPSYDFAPTNTVRVTPSAAVLTPYFPALAKGLVGQMWLGNTGNGYSGPITVTSSDPSKATVTTNPFSHGQESVTATVSNSYYPPVWVEVLDDSSPVAITVTAPGYQPGAAPLQFGRLAAGFFYNSAYAFRNLLPGPVELKEDETQTVAFGVYVIPRATGSLPDSRILVAPDSAIQASIGNSNPQAATPEHASFSLEPGSALNPFQFDIKGAHPGKAQLRGAVTAAAQVRDLGPLTISTLGVGVSMKPAMVGFNLMAPVALRLTGRDLTGPVNVKLTSADPSKLLLSADDKSAGAPAISLSMTYPQTAFYVHGLASAGAVDVIADTDQYARGKTSITLAPSGLAWTTSVASLPRQPYSNGPAIGSYILDPTALTALARQGLRPGVEGAVPIRNSAPSLVTLDQDTLPLSAATDGSLPVSMSASGEGSAELTIVQPAGFTAPVGRGALHVSASRPSITIYPQPLGSDGQGVLRFEVPTGFATPVTFTSTDPARLLLATSKADAGSAAVTVNRVDGTYGPIYMNAAGGPADVKVTASAAGAAESSAIVNIVPVALGLSAPTSSYGGDPTVDANTQQDSVTVTLSPKLQGSNGYSEMTLRPGLDPIPVVILSSNPDVVSVVTGPVLYSQTSSAQFQVKPRAAGQAKLTITPPPGFGLVRPGSGRSVTINVAGPSFALAPVTVAQDLQAPAALSVIRGATSIPADVDVTLASGDASKVLLSADGASPGAGTLPLHFSRGQSVSRPIYVQALDSAGVVPISITAPGYSDATATVTLAPLTWVLDQQAVEGLLKDGTQTVRAAPAAKAGSFYGTPDYPIRPGLAPFDLALTSSDASVATVSPAALRWAPGTRELSFTVRPVGAGVASVSLKPPAPYVAPPDLPVRIRGGQFIVSSGLRLGKDLQDSFTVWGDSFSRESVTLTAASGNPSALLVSASGAAAGKASITIVNPAGQTPRIYVQALGEGGTVPVTLSADGYQDATVQVELSRTVVRLSPVQSSSLTLTPLSAPVQFTAQLALNGSNSVQPLRAGAAPVVVQAMVSDAAVGAAAPSQLTFQPGDSAQALSFQPLAAGFTLLSLSVPAGFADPLSGRQQLITVSPLRLVFGTGLTVGKNLMRAVTISPSGPLAKDLRVTLSSSDPARLLLSAASADVGAQSVTVNLPAGSGGGAQFWIHGLDSQGPVSVTASAAGASASTVPVTLEPSGFRFNSSTLSALVNGQTSVNVISCSLDPVTLAPDTDQSLRRGMTPVAVGAVSSNTAIVPAPASVNWTGGDSVRGLPVTPAAAGSATLTLTQPPGFTAPSSRASLSITVR